MRVLDLFCGMGGSSIGAERAGAVIAAGIDRDGSATEAYTLRFPDARMFNAPVEELDPKNLAKYIGDIDIILASPPCTMHSAARRNKTPRPPEEQASMENAPFEVLRYAKRLKPEHVVVENVAGFQHWERHSEWFQQWMDAGWKCGKFILKASDYGTPTIRKRLFYVFQKPPLERRWRLHWQPVLPPKPHPGGTYPNTALQDVLEPIGETEAVRARDYPQGHRMTDAFERVAKLPYHQAGIWTTGGTVKHGLMPDGKKKWSIVGPADTPHTITCRGAVTITERRGKELYARTLLAIEAARIQGFKTREANAMLWGMPRYAALRLIGNAVPPPVMQAIIERWIDR